MTSPQIYLERSARSLSEAMATPDVGMRYAHAHVSALQAAAALLAARARPVVRRGRPVQRNAWVLLAQVAPELAEWADFFAAGAAKRAAAEAGSRRAVTEREADDLVRDADRFLGLVEEIARADPPPSSAHPSGGGLMTDPFVHLHVASGYSLRHGANAPDVLVERAAEHGMDTLALTDRDGTYGAVRFVQACRRHEHPAGARGGPGVPPAPPERPARSPGSGPRSRAESTVTSAHRG